MPFENRDEFTGYTYDPIIKQYDTTFWKTTAGTPAISSNLIRYNAAASSSYIQHLFADIDFKVTVPAIPTSGDVRQFGFRNPSGDTLGAVYYDITGTAFTGKVVLEGGTVVSTTLTWSAGYTATATSFRIRWERDEVRFIINGVQVGQVSASPQGIPKAPLAARIVNSNADNMDVTYMTVRSAYQLI